MKMKSARLIAAFLAAAMTVSAAPPLCEVRTVSAANATAESEALKKTVAEVKSRISVPNELDKFIYGTTESYENVTYTLCWYSEGKTSQRYVEDQLINYDKMLTVVYSNGLITYYSYSDGKSRNAKRGFAKLSEEEQLDFAKKHLHALEPNLNGNAVIERDTSSADLRSRTVDYNISRTEYGVTMDNNWGSISIDRDTGELLDFSLNWYNDAKPKDASSRISVSEANAIYKERKGLSEAFYQYFINREYDSATGEWIEERFVLPVYVPEKSGENEIDAFTGEYTAYYADRKKYSYTDEYTWDMEEPEMLEEEAADEVADGVSLDSGFTEEELKAFEEESNYVTKDKIIQILKDDPYITFNDNLVFVGRDISRTTDDDGKETVRLYANFKHTSKDEKDIYLNVTMDPFSGEILNFDKSYYYQYPEDLLKSVDKKTARQTADAAAAHFMGDKMKKYKFSNIEIYDYYLDDKQTIPYAATITYTRYENGLEAPFDSISVMVNANNEVLSFDYTYHNIDFPKPELVSGDEAYASLFVKMKPELVYKGFKDLKMNSHIYLTYIYDEYFTLNALTGERINYNGKPYYVEQKVSESKTIEYSDISGHRYENEIRTLLKYNVYVTDESKLCPDDDITIGEFMQLLNSAYGIGSIYSFKTTEERELYYSRKLTYEELAKMYVYYYTNMEAAAELQGIYKSPFTDVSENSEYCGYIAIAKAQGFINGKGGLFHPSAGISKADCLKITYDYLSGDDNLKLYQIFKV